MGLRGERFQLVGPGAAHDIDRDYPVKALPREGSVTLTDVTTRHGVLVLAGPKARELLQKLADADLSNAAFPWRSGRAIPVGFCAGVRAPGVNFAGSLGWELHRPTEYQTHLHDEFPKAGAEFDSADAGMRAMGSLRLEKS